MSYNDLRKGRVSIPGQEYFITFVVEHRQPLFRELHLAQCFAAHLDMARDVNGTGWLAWLLMPDHFHGLLRLEEAELATAIGSLKGRTARAINATRGRQGRVWQVGYFDRALRKDEDRRAVARYIVANPLRAGLVDHIGEYPYWDSVYL